MNARAIRVTTAQFVGMKWVLTSIIVIVPLVTMELTARPVF